MTWDQNKRSICILTPGADGDVHAGRAFGGLWGGGDYKAVPS